MIKAVVQIGNMIKEGILDAFSVEKDTKLISLNFNTEKKAVEVKVERDLTSDFLVASGYKEVTRGSGKEFSVIFPYDKLKYIGLNTEKVKSNKFPLFNIYKAIKEKQDPKNQKLAEDVKSVIDTFYQQDGKSFIFKDRKDVEQRIKNISENSSACYIQICINNSPLWKDFKQNKDYEILEKIRCSICGKYGIVKQFDTNQLKFLKFFGKDKLGFYPDTLYENQWKVLSFCPECAEGIIKADTYIKNNLNIKIAKNLNLLIIPDLSKGKEIPSRIIKRAFSTLSKAVSVISNWDELKRFDIYAEEIFKRQDIKLHLLVNTYDGQTLKIYASLINIPPSRIKDFALALKDISLFMLKEALPVNFSLRLLYRILSGKSEKETQKSKDILGKELFAQVFKNLLEGNPIPDITFIKSGLSLATWEYKNLEKDIFWLKTILAIEGFLLIKRKMAGESINFYGGNIMSNFYEEAKDYLRKIPIYTNDNGEIRRGLFLLGYLISQIATEQRKKGLSDTILDKILFKGMNKEQVLRLVNQVFEYMRIYDLLDFPDNKQIWGEITEAFDKQMNNWSLLPEETVYFILSGYTFLTSRKLTSKDKNLVKEESDE